MISVQIKKEVERIQSGFLFNVANRSAVIALFVFFHPTRKHASCKITPPSWSAVVPPLKAHRPFRWLLRLTAHNSITAEQLTVAGTVLAAVAIKRLIAMLHKHTCAAHLTHAKCCSFIAIHCDHDTTEHCHSFSLSLDVQINSIISPFGSTFVFLSSNLWMVLFFGG